MKKRPKKEVCESHLEVNLRDYWVKYYKEPIQPQYIIRPIIPQKVHGPGKTWRLDFLFPEAWLAVEIQGFGTGHTSYTGMQRDYEKHNAALSQGIGIIYLMSWDLKRETISKTCQYIQKIHTIRKNNDSLMRGIHELRRAHLNIQEIEQGRLDNTNQGRGGLIERLNQHKLQQRND